MLTLVALVAVAQVPSAATGEPARVALLPVLVDAGDDMTTSEVFRLVSARTRRRPTVRLMSIDEFFFYDGGQRADRVLACGSDTRCLARQLAPFRADLGVVVIVNGQLDPPLVGVITIDTHRARLVAERFVQTQRPQLKPTMTAVLADHFDRAGHPEWARLEVQVDPAGAEIRIAPGFRPQQGRPNAFEVPPGVYRVIAEQDGYRPAEAQVVVTAGQTTPLALRLEEDRAWFDSPWFWVGTAAVVVTAATVTTVLLTRSESTCGCILTQDQPVCPPCP